MTGEDAEKLFFWVQRSNCCLQESPKYKVPSEIINRVYSRCSRNYIERAIDMVVEQAKIGNIECKPLINLPRLVQNTNET
ncbi:MAG: hypothetical protein E4H14_08950 [Candidatus Thorarchaeota archaeon]|nr:MAG: hypothetical protein E4H14_08950 [Candidatus Thorarchaeota archaeon]